jgi:ABC-2 type transport system permease protein
LILTWVIPVGIMTTFPIRALSGGLTAGTLVGSLSLALVLTIFAAWFFRFALRRYSSASS